MFAKRMTQYDMKGAPSRIVKDGVRYALWEEYPTKAKAQEALKFRERHRGKGFIRRYMSKYSNPVYAYYTAIGRG